MEHILENKNAVIYGAAGGLGRGVAHTFALQGATVHLVGRRPAPLERLAKEITAAGGKAHTAVVDALDESAVQAHLQKVVAESGSVDISFNLIARGDVQGTPFLDMRLEDFTAPIINGLTSTFITARAASQQMAKQGSGVILALTSSSGDVQQPHANPFNMGGTGPADAATESFVRYLAAEVGQYGVRVLGIWTAGVAETFAAREDDNNPQRQSTGLDEVQIEQAMASFSMLKRGPHLAQVADTAAFLASDLASGITATMVNVTSGVKAC